MVNVEDFRESLLERLDVNNLERNWRDLKVGKDLILEQTWKKRLMEEFGSPWGRIT